jgi:hypothetical protein
MSKSLSSSNSFFFVSTAKKVGAFGDLGVSKCVRFEGVKGYAEDVVEGAIVRGSLYYIPKRAELRVL